MKKTKTLSVKYNDSDIPQIKIKKKSNLTFNLDNEKNIEIVGNRKGLKLLAKALLGVAGSERKDGFHIHLDELYEINKENKTFQISKKEV
ncbi:Imm32 family immunity protein [Tenacibaculum maritimum]|uniref:Uncharacterized protein n=1 Tax=Tenacibaculum maritimum NCIMB 2154 TaxID=1349785 RepID=A0A2H1ED99_9FLAO|nr:hypothetical protein [Tenacibaculum maritimum]QCD63090.1 hypothetical protein B9C57_11410 [Tenacibaculum maritimum]CAA0160477.1 hypothetical protein NACSLCCMFF_120080 [Tenacibaculum maritimum]CAA0175885.1 hypothetical protein UCDSB2_150090 [Tenacibaculum maritimum]CAA0184606.1 hypothetical protein TMP248_170082 [Tenacibaculum maritimum]CAA0196828.1 hypothetical protein JIP4600_220002 [Tenacibaculum maritimum]